MSEGRFFPQSRETGCLWARSSLGPGWAKCLQDTPSDMGQAGRPPFPLQSVEYGGKRPAGLRGCGGDFSVFTNAFPFFLDEWLDHNFPACPPGWVGSYDWSQAIRQCTKGVHEGPAWLTKPSCSTFHALSLSLNVEAQGSQQGHHKKVAGSLERKTPTKYTGGK